MSINLQCTFTVNNNNSLLVGEQTSNVAGSKSDNCYLCIHAGSDNRKFSNYFTTVWLNIVLMAFNCFAFYTISCLFLQFFFSSSNNKWRHRDEKERSTGESSNENSYSSFKYHFIARFSSLKIYEIIKKLLET